MLLAIRDIDPAVAAVILGALAIMIGVTISVMRTERERAKRSDDYEWDI